MGSGNLSDDEFDRALRRRLWTVRAQRGECPAIEVLTRFSFGDSPEAEAEEVRAHVARCGLCDALLYRMKDFPATAGAYGAPKRRLVEYLRSPALGYVLALALVYPAYRGLKPSPSVPPVPSRPAAVEAPPGLSLNAVRGETGGPAATMAGDHFLIHFALPVSARRQYRATIRAADGKEIVAGLPIRSWDSFGNFSLLCRASDFPSGSYSVEVEELEEGAGTVLGRKVFRFVR